MASGRTKGKADPAAAVSPDDLSGSREAFLETERLDAQEFSADYEFSPGDADLQAFRSEPEAARRRVSFAEVKEEYTQLWAEMAIRRERLREIDGLVGRIVRNKARYQAVERLTRVPWFVIALVHNLEASGDFGRHLHNGDPLTARTVQVPAGRPRTGNPPFTWEESAVDALDYDGLTRVTDWSIEHLAYLFEGFNGWGYRLYHPHVKSPYLWSFSNHYTRGKYVADGRWSETAVSRQCGAMVLVKRLEQGGHVRLSLGAPEPPVERARLSFALREDVGAEERAQQDDFAREILAAGRPAAALRAWPVETQLTDGPGIFGYYAASKRYGTASTIAALREAGRIWNLRRAAPRIGVGDISLRGGGDIAGHASHETGRDVDMRPIKNDGSEGPVIWWQSKYSHALTQELIDILYANGIVKVKVIGFNDPNIQGCVRWDNHDNHLHVRFHFEDEAPGYPTLQLGQSNAPPVRELQRRLNGWARQNGVPPLTLDGDFGQNTWQAVVRFQSAMGLEADGVVGEGTWRKSLDYLANA